MQILHKTNYDFVSKRKFFIVLSICIIVGGIIFSSVIGLDYGIDFEGGIEMVTQFEKPINTERVREAVESTGIKDAEIKSFGSDNQYIIRIKSSGTATETIANAIANAIPDVKMDLVKVDNIGPKIGSELRMHGFLAILITMVFMLIYIAFRFEFMFGIGAIVALVHDIMITFTISIILQKTGIATMEINMTFLAAMLTVVGHSINHTVIIFDRVRENMDLMKGQSFEHIVNTSVNNTLSRTVVTVLTVLIVLVVLMLFGGPVLRPFAIIMILGTVFGVYSSIWISSSVVIWYHERKEKKKLQTAK